MFIAFKMIYRNFEEIPIWQESRKLICEVYKLTEYFKNDFELRNQLRRAALSISLNIAEGFERKTNKDFARFINMSKGSAGECRASLYIAHDLGYIPMNLMNEYITKFMTLSDQLSKFSQYLVRTSNSKMNQRKQKECFNK